MTDFGGKPSEARAQASGLLFIPVNPVANPALALGARIHRSVPPPAVERVNLLREPDAGNPHVRFDERDVETEYGEASKAPADERAGNR